MLSTPYLFNIVVEIVARAVRQLNRIQKIQIKMKKVKASLFTDDIIVYISNPKNSTRELLQLINIFRKVAGYKTNSKNLVVAFLTNGKWAEKEIWGKKPSQ